jgi:hypothetical protein
MPLSKKNQDILEKIILNENIYIYTKRSGKFYPARSIKELFISAKDDKEGQACTTLLNEINIRKKTATSIDYRFSALVLKYINQPSFLSEYIKNWTEQKLAYLFLFDFGNYLMILKRNISGITGFINNLESLDYQIIAKLFETDTTLFEKFSIQNLDISKEAMRAKSVESDNLVENYNYIGSNTYVLNNMRLNNEDQRYQISLNTSRISKSGEKISIDQLANWCYELIVGVEAFVEKESYLDNFAKPCDYQKERATLEPTTVTILLMKLIEDLGAGKIQRMFYEFGERQVPLKLFDYVKGSSISVDLLEDQLAVTYKADPASSPPALKKLKLNMNEKSIRLSSPRLRRVMLQKENGVKEKLIDYLNTYQCFVVNFNECDMVYSNKKLFKDSALLGSIEYMLKAFDPDPVLTQITSEKGENELTNAHTHFPQHSMFNYVEQRFNNVDYLVLDDLGDEWADHIAIHESKVTFIHSKYSDAVFSATAFTDIIGQTQKNIGNMFPVDRFLRAKRDKWTRTFSLDHVNTSIQRLRVGVSVDGFIDRYSTIKLNPNPKRAVFLSLNFVSKQDLVNHLNRLNTADAFRERKQAIQLLWFISSLIASCKENSIELTITCKP